MCGTHVDHLLAEFLSFSAALTRLFFCFSWLRAILVRKDLPTHVCHNSIAWFWLFLIRCACQIYLLCGLVWKIIDNDAWPHNLTNLLFTQSFSRTDQKKDKGKHTSDGHTILATPHKIVLWNLFCLIFGISTLRNETLVCINVHNVLKMHEGKCLRELAGSKEAKLVSWVWFIEVVFGYFVGLFTSKFLQTVTGICHNLCTYKFFLPVFVSTNLSSVCWCDTNSFKLNCWKGWSSCCRNTHTRTHTHTHTHFMLCPLISFQCILRCVGLIFGGTIRLCHCIFFLLPGTLFAIIYNQM